MILKNRSGNTVLKKKIDTNFDQSWDGILEDRTIAPSGIYFIEIIEEEGRTIGLGTLTIVK